MPSSDRLSSSFELLFLLTPQAAASSPLPFSAVGSRGQGIMKVLAMMLEVGSSKPKPKPKLPPPRILVATGRLDLLCITRRSKALL